MEVTKLNEGDLIEDAMPPSPPDATTPPVTRKELIVVVLLVVLSDLTIFRGHGYAAYAALFAVGPVLLLIGAATRKVSLVSVAVFALMLLASAKLLWNGSAVLVCCTWALLFAFSMTLAGLCPYVMETFLFASQTIRSGYEGLRRYKNGLERRADQQARGPLLNFGLPIAALLAFGTVFILANPDLVAFVSERAEIAINALKDWLSAFSAWEVVFWGASLWISVGLIRPYLPTSYPATYDGRPEIPVAETELFAAFRNTLLTVIVLFAVYLVFEFRTLWFREFPPEFFKTGRVHKYAHEGAAWLTVALAMATAVLSLIFRGRTLGDPRLARLKSLAWLWSLENALLAITVYHRLLIYIGYNGMTRMRVIGLLGISCAVIGFLLVVWKIIAGKRFVWLLRRQLWTVAFAVLLYALLPVDPMVHRYNVSRMLAGDPAPAVQISVHPITPDGYLVLDPLLQSDDEIIREGVRAILAEQKVRADNRADVRRADGWTAFQLADQQLRNRLSELAPQLQDFDKSGPRDEARERFDSYVFQWY